MVGPGRNTCCPLAPCPVEGARTANNGFSLFDKSASEEMSVESFLPVNAANLPTSVVAVVSMMPLTTSFFVVSFNTLANVELTFSNNEKISKLS